MTDEELLSQEEVDALLSQAAVPAVEEVQQMVSSPPPVQSAAPARSAAMKNVYMEQVMEQQREVSRDLKAKRRRAAPQAAPAQLARGFAPGEGGGEGGPDAPAVDVRITGWWRWKRVIVPPNAYVVHTRLGRGEPLHCGLGTSFDFNPYSDSYLVVPAAMQTIMISANCICKERQGILVQGYVQWIVDDFRTAYRKLDFSDPYDPMKVVNVQLREQAEAAIKDTVAVMSIDDVLTDKQPIIKVLTARLRALAEGDGQDAGLGLRIITVQIKEAVVSSTRLWESLQSAFRAERSKEARLAELLHQEEVRVKESEAERTEAARRIALDEDVAQHRSRAQAAAFDREQSEKVRRAEVEAGTLAELTQNEKQRLQAEAELEQARIKNELAGQELREQAKLSLERARLELLELRRKIENDVSPGRLQAQLIESLPQVARELPKPNELKSVSLGGLDGLGPLVQGVTEIVDRVRQPAS